MDILKSTVTAHLGGSTKHGGFTPMDLLAGSRGAEELKQLLRDYGGRCVMNCNPEA